MNQAEISANKEHWRRVLKEKRQKIESSRRLEATEESFEKLLPFCLQFRYVLSYMSFGSELDLSKLNHYLMENGQLVLPLINQGTLLLYQVQSFEHLQKHPWGFLQPNPDKCLPIPSNSIELALIPGLGFDLKTKCRIGYGKGHYDRLLLDMFQTQLFGVGFKEQEVMGLLQESHDISMHKIYLF